jgi:hypothetical protein
LPSLPPQDELSLLTKRQNNVARQQAVQSELSTTLRAFYCELCAKQFSNVAQYDEHTNSYAHAHKARERDMKASAKIGKDVEARKEKERRREERELRKIAAAAGIKMAKPLVTPTAGQTQVGDEEKPAPKKSGWAAVPAAAQPMPGSRFGSTSAVALSEHPPRAGNSSVATVDGELLGSSAPPPPVHATAFRSSGWSSLDTTSRPQSPMPPSSTAATPASIHTQPSPSMRGGWSTVATAPAAPPAAISALSRPPEPAPPARRGWTSVSTPQPIVAPTPTAPTETRQPPNVPALAQLHDPVAMPLVPVVPDARPARPPPVPAKVKEAKREEQRQGWQQFRTGKGGRR